MRFGAILLIGTIFIALQPAIAKEYFGEFKDTLKGEFIDAKPRPLFKLTSEFRFLDPNGLLWSVPPQKEVDGASIPQALWSFIGGPFEGLYIKASVIHDYYCNEKIRTDHDTHRNFYYGMRAAEVDEWKAKFMYWAVATFGPKWKLDKRVVQQLTCSSLSGKLNCVQVPEIKFEPVALSSIDLGDPDVLAAALSKASTVARSLKTSDGKILDVTSIGQVSGSLAEIANSADKYRAVFLSKDFLKNSERLGVLSKWDAQGIEKVTAWEGNRIPTYNEAVILKPTERVNDFGTPLVRI